MDRERISRKKLASRSFIRHRWIESWLVLGWAGRQVRVPDSPLSYPNRRWPAQGARPTAGQKSVEGGPHAMDDTLDCCALAEWMRRG
jgi:hypothetical protein